jgi:hypothetical protein
MLDEHAVPPAPDNAEGSLDAATARLARLIYALAPHDGIFSQRIPGFDDRGKLNNKQR